MGSLPFLTWGQDFAHPFYMTQADLEPSSDSEFDSNIKLNGNFLWPVTKLFNNVYLIQSKQKRWKSCYFNATDLLPEF